MLCGLKSTAHASFPLQVLMLHMQGTAGSATGQASVLAKSTSTTKLNLTLGTMTVRAAFSHLPILQSALWAVQKVVLRPAPGNMATGGSVNDQFADKVRHAEGKGGLGSPHTCDVSIQSAQQLAGSV